ANPSDNFRLVGGVISRESLTVKRPRPVLHHAARNVSLNHRAGRAEGAGGVWVQERCQRALDEKKVGVAVILFLGKRHFVLADLDLELRKRLDVDKGVAKGNAGSGYAIDQEREVIMLAVAALKAEPCAANHERIRRRSIA